VIRAIYRTIVDIYYDYKVILLEWISEIQKPNVLDDIIDGLENLI
jgi:hypothetical protein